MSKINKKTNNDSTFNPKCFKIELDHQNERLNWNILFLLELFERFFV